MFIFDITDPLILILLLAATILFIFLAQEIKKSMVAAVPLFGYVILLTIHVIQVLTLSKGVEYLFSTLCYNIALDFLFVLITFIAYLWVDDIECKAFKKKSVNNSLDWFWKEI